MRQEVKEWMKKHPEEVAKVQEKRDRLGGVSLRDLAVEAPEDAVEKAREILIAGIIGAKGVKG